MYNHIQHPLDIAEIERQARQLRAEACRDLFRSAANGVRRVFAGRRSAALS